MDTKSLRYFLAVGELGSYSRAAEFLRISQPAISRQIRQLEAELGQELFNRQSHGVTPTEAGKLLLVRGQEIVRQMDRAQAEVRLGSKGPSGTVTLAVPPGAGHFLVPALVARLNDAYPALFLKIVGGFSVFIHEWLVRGQADLACIHDPLPQRGFHTEKLIREPVFLVGRPDVLPTTDGPLRIGDLGRVPLILPSRPNASRRLLDNWMAQFDVALDVRLEVDDPTLIRALLREGIGCSLLSQGAFQAEERLGELRALPFQPAAHWQLALVWATSTRPSSAVAAVSETIRETVRALHASGQWPGQLLLP